MKLADASRVTNGDLILVLEYPADALTNAEERQYGMSLPNNVTAFLRT